jgi:hypothetical protein
VELERRRAHPDVVGRRRRDRAVDAEDGDREAVAGPRVTREHDAVGGVEPADDRPAARAQRERQLAVDPDLGVVVDDDLEDGGHARRVQRADPARDLDVDAVPVERHAPVAEARHRLLGGEHAPRRVVEVGRLGVGLDVVGAVGRAAGAEVVGDVGEGDLADRRIRVAPAAADQRRAIRGLQVDDRQRLAGQHLGGAREPHAATFTTK